MLDYKKLKNEFTNKLQQFDKEQLQQWVAFDNNRAMITNLLDGKEVIIHWDTLMASKLSDPREQINTSSSNNSFAMAA